MSEHILIAGCGDLGRRTAQILLAQGHQVWGLRRSSPLPGSMGLQWIAADMTQADSLADLPQSITQVVFAATPDSRSEAAYRRAFIEGPRQVIAALDPTVLRRLLFVSSSAVYGEHHGDQVDENTQPAPLGFNGKILLEAEQCLASQAFEAVSLRLAGLYGPGRLQLLDRLKEGRARAPRTPPHWSNRIHIDDAAAAIAHLLALPNPDPIYIGADDTPLPLHVLYQHLAHIIGAPTVPDGPAPSGVGSKRLCNARLRQSGLALQWPDSREGYAALIRNVSAGQPR